MKNLLQKCDIIDFEYLSDLLDSNWSFTDDKGRKNLLEEYKLNPNDELKEKLVTKLDNQIRYYASADLAYLFRIIFSEDGAVMTPELIKDVADKLKVKIKMIGSVEAQLERLVKAVIEKEFLTKTPEQLSEAFRKLNIDPDHIDYIEKEIKKLGPVLLIPILIRLLGKEVVINIVETIIIGVIARIIGKEAAKQLVKELGKRNPIINALGPTAWVITGVWLAIDLQGPAYRKTIPSCLYLGVVGLRNGPEDGERFWEASNIPAE